MSLVQEFKDFAMRGNVVDLAVGLIMGSAFGKIVSSLMSDLIMPPIGYLIGGVQFSHLKVQLANPKTIELTDPITNEVTKKTLDPVFLTYGNFLQTTFDFMIVAFCVFMLVKLMNKMKNAQEKPAPATAGPTPTEALLMEIRDAIKAS